MERPKGDTGEGPVLSRLERMRKDHDDDEYMPDMPPVEAAWHLIGYLMEIGPTMPSSAGPSAVSHQEIAAWQTLSRVKLHPLEARFIRRLSREYVGEMQRAEKPDAKAPWQPVDYVPDYAGTANAMRNAIKSLAS